MFTHHHQHSAKQTYRPHRELPLPAANPPPLPPFCTALGLGHWHLSGSWREGRGGFSFGARGERHYWRICSTQIPQIDVGIFLLAFSTYPPSFGHAHARHGNWLRSNPPCHPFYPSPLLPNKGIFQLFFCVCVFFLFTLIFCERVYEPKSVNRLISC